MDAFHEWRERKLNEDRMQDFEFDPLICVESFQTYSLIRAGSVHQLIVCGDERDGVFQHESRR